MPRASDPDPTLEECKEKMWGTIDPGVPHLLFLRAHSQEGIQRVVLAFFTSPLFSTWLVLPEFAAVFQTAVSKVGYLLVGYLVAASHVDKLFTQDRLDQELERLITRAGRENFFLVAPNWKTLGRGTRNG